MKIAIIGLGYVGQPLARLFATKYPVVGFDINSNIDTIRDCNHYIITVPTPVNKDHRPDLKTLLQATTTVGQVLKKGDTVIYESTVYPGCTEEDCVPVLEKVSGLKFNADFFVGYSPERINPGDQEHTVEKITKITAGSTPETAQRVDALYASVIAAGTHLAPSIRVAEAAKLLENAQRDINIAFVNEAKKIFDTMGIDTNAVLEAATTKWNFMPFKPGLVGGYCIGTATYYLAHKAQECGYSPELILSGRQMNESMGAYVADEVVKKMQQQGVPVKGANILVLGITFKANNPDVRSSKVVDVVRALQEYGANVTIFDPLANPADVQREYDLESLTEMPQRKFDAVVKAVAHQAFDGLMPDSAVIYSLI